MNDHFNRSVSDMARRRPCAVGTQRMDCNVFLSFLFPFRATTGGILEAFPASRHSLGTHRPQVAAVVAAALQQAQSRRRQDHRALLGVTSIPIPSP